VLKIRSEDSKESCRVLNKGNALIKLLWTCELDYGPLGSKEGSID